MWILDLIESARGGRGEKVGLRGKGCGKRGEGQLGVAVLSRGRMGRGGRLWLEAKQPLFAVV